jgi:glutaredoxin
MNKKLILTASLFLIISTATIAVLGFEKNRNSQTPLENETAFPKNVSIADGKTILFYGDECPHCLKIETFLEEKEAARKISYEAKEVQDNADNRKIMMEKAAACKMKQNSVGVPFLWDGENGTCLIGVDQVMDFFQAKLDETNKK